MHLPPRPGRQNHRKTTDDPHTPGDGKDPAFITHGSSAKRCMTPLTAPLGAASGLASDTALIPASSLSPTHLVHHSPFGEKIFRPNGRRFTAGLKA